MLTKFTLGWGIEPFDKTVGGLPANVFNIVETESHQTGLLALGHFLNEGLSNDEKCVLVTFENPLSFVESFEKWNFKFYEHIRSEQFIYLYYRPNIASEIGLTLNYESIFKEIERLSSGVPHRIAIHQADTLFNLHSQMLINSCAHKLVTATKDAQYTVLGQYVQFNDPTHQALRISCMKNMTGFFSIREKPQQGQGKLYSLDVNRVPWFEDADFQVALKLEPGKGFVSAEPSATIVDPKKPGNSGNAAA